MSKMILAFQKCDVSVLTPLSYENQYNKWIGVFQELQDVNAL